MTDHAEVQRRSQHTAPSDTIRVREVEVDGDDADEFIVRMPITSTGEARDGEAFSRDRVEGFREQIARGGVGIFIDHGRNAETGSRYSALGKVGRLAEPELVERDSATDLDVDFRFPQPDEVDDAADTLREVLATLYTQARAGIPLTSSIGWSEDTGDRDVPGDADMLEASVVGIPSDPRTTTASAEPAAMARAVSAASSDFDVATFVRALRDDRAVGDDEWSAELRLFRIVPDEDDEGQFDDNVLGVGVSFPESGVYVDWHTAAFPDELDNPHVSEYGSVADLRKATGNKIVDMMPPAGARDERNVVEVGGEEIDLTPPEPVKNAATVALAKDDELEPDCGTGAGRQSGQAIAGDSVTDERIDDIAAYLTSHEEDVTAEGPPTDWTDEEWSDCGNLQYALWGGTGTGTGLEWAQSKANEVAAAKDEELPYPDRAARNLDDPEFGVDDGVMWSSNDTPVHGRVAEVGDEFSPAEGVTITGDEGEAVYLIHELDDSLEPPQYRRENVAKPESSLNESQADLPPTEGNFADSENSMSEDDTEPDAESGTDTDGQSLRGMEEKMDEMREMLDENTRMCEEMYEEMMGGDGEEEEDEGDESESEPEGESDADAEDDEERTITIDGEERSVDDVRDEIADLREQTGEESAESKTENRASEEGETTEEVAGYGFAGMEN